MDYTTIATQQLTIVVNISSLILGPISTSQISGWKFVEHAFAYTSYAKPEVASQRKVAHCPNQGQIGWEQLMGSKLQWHIHNIVYRPAKPEVASQTSQLASLIVSMT